MEQRKKVLVVEDDPHIRRLVMRYLEELGFSVQEAADGLSAIARLEQTPPELVCLDLMLPATSGLEVCEHVRRTEGLRHIPIMVISSRTMPTDRATAEQLGASTYLTKPFTRLEFQEGVRRTMALGQQRTP